MRLRTVGSLVAVGIMAISLVSCASSKSSGDSKTTTASAAAKPTFAAGTTMATLAAKGSVTVGIKFDQPLFGLKGLDGKYNGFDVEIAKIIAAGLGIDAAKISYIETPSAVREEKIEQGAADYVVATYTINAKRKERISFAGPYYEAGQAIMVKSSNPKNITGPDSFKTNNAKVCSVSGSTPAETIKTYLGNVSTQLVLFDVYSKCADALRNNQVDAVTTDNVILAGLVSTNGSEFKLLSGTFTKEPYGIGVKKADVAFCTFINDTLTKASKDGAYAKAWKDTAGTVDPTVPTLPTLAACT